MTISDQENLSKIPAKNQDDKRQAKRDYNSLLSIFLLIFTAFLATIMFSPSMRNMELPVAESNIGKVSISNIRADRDYVITDEEATLLKQDEAAYQVRAFYKHDMDAATKEAQNIHEAFSFMRSLIGTVSYGSSKSKQTTKAGIDTKKIQNKVLSKTQAALLRENKDEFVKILQVPIDDDEFDSFIRCSFSKECEEGLEFLVTPIMQDMVVASRELLAAERTQGITVLRMSAHEQRAEGTISSIGAIKDLDEARKILEKKADFMLAEFPRNLRNTIISVGKKLITPNLRYDKEETERRKEEARSRVIPVTITLKKGQMIIRDGDRIEQRHIMIFRGMKEAQKDQDHLITHLGIFIFTLLVMFIPYYFARAFIKKFAPKPLDIVFMQVLLIALILTGKLFFEMGTVISENINSIPMRVFMFLIPFPAGAMMCRFVLNSETALVFSIVASLFSGICIENNFLFSGYTLIGSIVAAHGVAQATQRTTVLWAGVHSGIANIVMAISISLFSSEPTLSEIGLSTVFALANGLLSAMIVTAFTPVVEVVFGYVTDIKLLELANLNHPLLKELVVQAPGTYHHSILVGSLVEAAAESIGANPLLARVTAYYHDIGKVKKPQYFGENQKEGQNKLDQNTPPMSALIIKAHVKDGIEIATTYKLGQPIIDTIAQHHGTSLIKYFYLKAKAISAPDEIVDENIFRYPGPKPQTREAALVMMADAVEAAAKSVPDLDQVRLRGLVQKIINGFFRDQQLSECDLTLKDLHKIAAAFIRVLEGIYHQRPEYQEPPLKVSDEKGKSAQEGQAAGTNGQKSASQLRQDDDSEDEEEDFKRLGL